MKINDFIKREFITASAYIRVAVLKPLLLQHSAIVIKEKKSYMGVLTPNDVIRKTRYLVIDCLSYKSHVGIDNTIHSVIQIMKTECTDVLPVLENKEIIGLIFKNDLLDYLKIKNLELEFKIENLNRKIEEHNSVLKKRIIETIVLTEENERKRFATDLHDEIGPELIDLNLYINNLKYQLMETPYSDILNTMATISRNNIGNYRKVITNVCNFSLDEYGLVDAINTEIKKKSIFQISFLFKTNLSNERFNRTIELVYYRLIKELLNNTIKHAEASEILIELKVINDELRLKYSDNGKGFDYNNIHKSHHAGIGLLSMLNRINSINGHYKIRSSPGSGFKLYLTSKI